MDIAYHHLETYIGRLARRWRHELHDYQVQDGYHETLQRHNHDDDEDKILIIIMISFAPISSKIKLSGATKPRD